MEKRHKEILITKRVELVENINIKDGLFTQMLARRLFNERGIRKIKTFNTSDEQIEELLNELPRKGPNAFKLFCESLIADDQEDIVNIYLKDETSENNNTCTAEQPQSATQPQITTQPQSVTQTFSATTPSVLTTQINVPNFSSHVNAPQSVSSMPPSFVAMPTTPVFTAPSLVTLPTSHITITDSNVASPSSHNTSSALVPIAPSSQINPLSHSVLSHRTDATDSDFRSSLCVSNSPTERHTQGLSDPSAKVLPDRFLMKHWILDPDYKGVPLAPPKDVLDSRLLPEDQLLRKVALENLANSDIRSLFSSSASPYEKVPEKWGGFSRADSIDAMHKRPYIPNPEYVGPAAKRLRTDDTIVLPVHDAKEIPRFPATFIKNHEIESFHSGGEFDDPDIDLTDGPVRVQVELSTRQFFLAQYKKAYAMRRIPRGKALIINVNEVEGKPPRRGTDIDRDNLHNLFTQLHFDVIVYNDCNGLSAKDIAVKLQDFANLSDHQHADSAVICLLSHGEDGYIFGTDGKRILLDDVFSLFDNKNCKLLIGKPKVFIIQACRGGALDSGVAMPQLDETDGADVSLKQLPTQSDMLICYPTQAGYYAWRNRERGSWYIEALVHVFMKYAKTEDICAMLNRVNHLVSRKISRCPQIDMDQMSQMSEYKSTLRMPHLYFFPGIGCG